MAGIHKSTSPYVNTGVSNEYIKYLDIWSPIKIPESANDYEYIIETKYDERPDLLANDLYGSPRLWWVFAIRNKDVLIDPIADFTAGTKIIITSKSTVENIF